MTVFQPHASVQTGPPLVTYPTGRAIYECTDAFTGLNRIPIEQLSSLILAGAQFSSRETLPVPPEELVIAALVEGSWLEADGVIQQNIISATQTKVAQYIDKDITREWIHANGAWILTDYSQYGTDGQRQVGEPVSNPDSIINYWYNALAPAGILLPAGRLYARLEELAELIRNAQRGPGAKTAIPGHVRNRHMVDMDLMSDKPYVFTGSELPLDRMTSTAVVDQLISETARLEPKYYSLTHITDTSNPVQRPSGEDRSLVLGPMFRFVEAMREQITGILALYGVTWTSERLHTSDVQARTTELALLLQLRDLNALTTEDFLVKARMLV